MVNINSKVTVTNKITKRIKGFSLVEVLLSVTLFTLFVLGISGGLAYSMQSSKVTAYKSKAVFLSDEGLEAARSIRNSSYGALISGTHGLASTGDTWTLSGSSETIGEYTRIIEISDIDSTTKQITSKVSWPATGGGSNTISVSTYLTNWLREIAQIWTTPKLGTVLDISGNQDTTSIAHFNNHAHAIRASGSPNLVSINISGDTPVVTNSLNGSVIPNNITIAPSGSFLATTANANNSELVIYDLTNQGVPNQISTYNASGNANAVASYIHTNNYIYMVRVASGDPELIILNATNPNTPTLVGTAEYGSDVNDIVVSGDYAFVATSNTAQELVIFNISNPSSPTIAGTYNTAGNSQGTSIAITGNTLFLGTEEGNVFIINISTQTTPTAISTFNIGTTNRVNDISLKNDNTLMFIATDDVAKGFIVVDISNIALPIQKSFIDVTGTLNGVTYDTVRDKVYAVGSNNSAEFVIINSN